MNGAERRLNTVGEGTIVPEPVLRWPAGKSPPSRLFQVPRGLETIYPNRFP
jgi:hypothetical protein